MQCSQQKQWYLNVKGLHFDDEIMRTCHRRALNASAQIRKPKRKCDENMESAPTKRMDSGLSLQRMAAIEYLFSHTFGHAKPQFWKDLNVVPEIMRRLDIPRGSRECVVNILNRSRS